MLLDTRFQVNGQIGKLFLVAILGLPLGTDRVAGQACDFTTTGFPPNCLQPSIGVWDCSANGGVGGWTCAPPEEIFCDNIHYTCLDCNMNGVCDWEELEGNDCNGNFILDECEHRGPIFLSGHDADDFGHCWISPGGVGSDCGGLWGTLLTLAYDNSRSTGEGILAVGVVEDSIAGNAINYWNDATNGGPGAVITYTASVPIPVVDFNAYRVVYVPSSDVQTTGGLTQTDLDALNLRKADICQFVNFSGGGLIALTEEGLNNPFAWLPIPIEAQFPDLHDGACPTPELLSLLPLLSCADLSPATGPYHNIFSGPPGFLGMRILSAWEDLAQTGQPDLSNPVLLGSLPIYTDCNLNQIPDSCEHDCTGNGIPDSCDIDSGIEEDCNLNGIPDSCDIASGFSQDVNENGIPDECIVCFGDINPQPDGNGTVNIDDLVAVLNAFGDCPAPPTLCPADLTPPGGNGTVNIDDLVALLNAFGLCPAGAQGGSSNATISGLQITSVSFDLGFPDEFGVVDAASSALVSASWIANQNGSNSVDVYRLWIAADSPSSTLTFIGGGVASGDGETSQPLVLSAGKNAAFYVPNGDYTSGVNVGLLAIDGGPGMEFFQTQAYGSFIAIGSATTSGPGPMILGDPSGLAGILTGAVNEANTGWGTIPSPGLGVVSDGNGGWRILIGQFAVPQGKTFTAAVRMVGDEVDTYSTISSATLISIP